MTRKSRRRVGRDQAAAARQVTQQTQAEAMEDKPPSAWIEVNQDTYVRALWYVDAPTFNVLAWMYKPKDKPWCCGFRFRYYRDDKAFNSADEKSGHTMRFKSGEPTSEDLDRCSEALNTTLEKLAMIEDCTWERLDVDATGVATVGILQTRPWAQVYAAGMTNTAHKPPGQA